MGLIERQPPYIYHLFFYTFFFKKCDDSPCSTDQEDQFIALVHMLALLAH